MSVILEAALTAVFGGIDSSRALQIGSHEPHNTALQALEALPGSLRPSGAGLQTVRQTLRGRSGSTGEMAEDPGLMTMLLQNSPLPCLYC